MKTGLNLLMDQPKQVGTDMVVDAVAAIHEYGAPVLIIDVGTATTISAVMWEVRFFRVSAYRWIHWYPGQHSFRESVWKLQNP